MPPRPGAGHGRRAGRVTYCGLGPDFLIVIITFGICFPVAQCIPPLTSLAFFPVSTFGGMSLIVPLDLLPFFVTISFSLLGCFQAIKIAGQLGSGPFYFGDHAAVEAGIPRSGLPRSGEVEASRRMKGPTSGNISSC